MHAWILCIDGIIDCWWSHDSTVHRLQRGLFSHIMIPFRGRDDLFSSSTDSSDSNQVFLCFSHPHPHPAHAKACGVIIPQTDRTTTSSSSCCWVAAAAHSSTAHHTLSLVVAAMCAFFPHPTCGCADGGVSSHHHHHPMAACAVFWAHTTRSVSMSHHVSHHCECTLMIDGNLVIRNNNKRGWKKSENKKNCYSCNIANPVAWGDWKENEHLGVDIFQGLSLPLEMYHETWPQLERQAKERWLHNPSSFPYTFRNVLFYVFMGQVLREHHAKKCAITTIKDKSDR